MRFKARQTRHRLPIVLTRRRGTSGIYLKTSNTRAMFEDINVGWDDQPETSVFEEDEG